MIILGLNAFHGDSSACLVRDGVLIAAAEEERFRRLKHWAGFPSHAIAWCLEEAGLKLSDVDVIATNQDSKAHLPRKLLYTIQHRPSLKLIADRLDISVRTVEVHRSRVFDKMEVRSAVELANVLRKV